MLKHCVCMRERARKTKKNSRLFHASDFNPLTLLIIHATKVHTLASLSVSLSLSLSHTHTHTHIHRYRKAEHTLLIDTCYLYETKDVLLCISCQVPSCETLFIALKLTSLMLIYLCTG